MTGENKERLDLLLVKKGYFHSRSKAQGYIMGGRVLVNGIKIDKPGTRFKDDVDIKIIRKEHPYVSRGGLKLAKAVKEFGLTMKNKKILDIGASTGGFTHCALINGAKKVYAVDVGYGQLAWELQNDPRVVSLERTNARYLEREDIGETVDMATIDVSFISLRNILPAVSKILVDGGEVVALIKPQFEAGRENVGKKGVVREPKVHVKVIQNVIKGAEKTDLYPLALTYSPIKGPRGNIEYLIYMIRSMEKLREKVVLDVSGVVGEAWKAT
ncbi:MAG: TlyA family RNA methyltransferase [Clostridia bacterium]|nr:TlyA family RNA methyltransferase [Clostridia bacterium]